MLLLETIWRPDKHWSALLAHCPEHQLPQLATALGNSPLARLPCYWPSADGALPIPLPASSRIRAVITTEAHPENTDTPHLRRAGLPITAVHSIVTGVTTLANLATLQGHTLEFCGSWFTAPLTKAAPNPAQPILLELLSLIVHDADTAALEKTIAKAPQLTFNLLRLVNSVSMGAHRQVESIHQAIALLGRRQLQRWLQLLLYAEQYGPHDGLPPLFVAAALRAKRLENWAQAGLLDGLQPDAAFMTGMLSLLDRLFGQPLESLLAPLPLSPMLEAGLLRGEGEIGAALRWLTLAEAGEAEALADLAGPRVAASQQWLQAEVNSLGWAHTLLDKGAP